MNFKSVKSSRGFTLVELIIVMAIFMFVIGAAIGIFLSIIQSQRKILSEQQFLNQVSYVEEYMSKAMRMASPENGEGCLIGSDGNSLTGQIYLLTQYDSSSDPKDLMAGFYKGIKFINQTGDSSGDPVCQEFYLDNKTDPHNPVLMEQKGTFSPTNPPVALTSAGLSGMQINYIKFSINGMDGSATANACTDSPDTCGATSIDGVQPRVTILMNVKVPNDNQEPIKTIQTTVSQRDLNAN